MSAIAERELDELAVLLSLPKEIRANVMDIFQMVYEKQYTGPVTFHCHLGQPKTVQILPPQIRLTD